MAFIGNTNTTQAFTPAVDFFSGNASTTAFTLSRPVASAAQVQAVISNVPQNPGDAFTVSGNTITFTSAPPSGTNNIYVYYTSPITQVIQPSQGTVGAVQMDVASGGLGTGATQLPTGTTAQRPTGSAGLVRYNSTNGNPEWYSPTAGAWLPFYTSQTYAVDILVVAGAGGGGPASGSLRGGGGGGAGGMIQSSQTFTVNTAYAITIGAGGAAQAVLGTNGNNGNNTTFGSLLTAIAGGGGGGGGSGVSGNSGGSGGGAGDATGAISGGTATSGQGNRGGNTPGSSSSGAGGAGGGGAGSAGVDGNQTSGGSGLAATINGTTYAAGGAGGSRSGGENGATGAANTGNGGGGGGGTSGTGGAGGSGIVIVRYPGSQRGTGGTITSSNGYTIHTFTSSGTYTA